MLKRLRNRKSLHDADKLKKEDEIRSRILNTHDHLPTRYLPRISRQRISKSTRQWSFDFPDEFKELSNTSEQVSLKTRKIMEGDVVDIELLVDRGNVIIRGTSINSLKEVTINIPIRKSIASINYLGKEILRAFRNNYKLSIANGKLIIVAPSMEEIEKYSDISQQYSVKEKIYLSKGET